MNVLMITFNGELKVKRDSHCICRILIPAVYMNDARPLLATNASIY